MDKAWKQILASAVIGLLLPRVVLMTAVWLTPKAQPEQTEPTQSQTQPTEVTMPTVGDKLDVPVYIPVLQGPADITVMELETYVVGVVLAEMPASFEPEALKAQAVVARTYALRRIKLGDRHPDGAVCTSSDCCQAYLSEKEYLNSRGTDADIVKIRQAVLQTAGLVLTYQGKLAEATYFSCSGGRTEDALEVWGSDYPYLQAVDSPGEDKAAAYRDSVFFTWSELENALGCQFSGSPESRLGKTTYTRGGGVKTMIISGKTYSGTRLRQLLELNSTCFTMTAEKAGVTVHTSGKGHRVGMSQYGADAMALSGCDYREILAYYYSGTGIDKFRAIG